MVICEWKDCVFGIQVAQLRRIESIVPEAIEAIPPSLSDTIRAIAARVSVFPELRSDLSNHALQSSENPQNIPETSNNKLIVLLDLQRLVGASVLRKVRGLNEPDGGST